MGFPCRLISRTEELSSLTMKLFLLAAALAAATLAEQYTITVNTKSHYNPPYGNIAITDSPVSAAAIDYKGNLIEFGVLNTGKDGRSSWLTRTTDGQVFTFNSETVFDKIGCLILRAGDDDAWLLESAALSSETDSAGVYGENPDDKWLSTDTSGDVAHLALMFCHPPPQ